MKNRSRTHFLSLSFIAVLAMLINQRSMSSADNSTANTDISVIFDHKVGIKLLSQNSSYVNDFGETFTINRFKYYISNIKWLDETSGRSYSLPGSYFLIDEAEPLSKQIDLKIPQGTYTGISFIVGVDSLKNVSGAQDGSLDPINGMFWTWQTGYIMAKLEGTTPVSKLPRKMFEFHIGGYKGAYNVLQPIKLSFRKNLVLSNATNPAAVHIAVDINKWFSGRHALPFSGSVACMTPGKLAHQYAENYFTMFSADSIQQK